MNKTFQYISLGVSTAFLIGIGLVIDRIGGYGIRTDDVSSSVVLSVSQPVLPGVPLTVRWQGNQERDIDVTLRLISGEEVLVLGTGGLLVEAMPVVFPCALPPAPFRLELIDTTNRAILGVMPVSILPPGPDCVR